MEEQQWGRFRNFPGCIEREEEEEALRTATMWKDRKSAIWTDGSRLIERWERRRCGGRRLASNPSG